MRLEEEERTQLLSHTGGTWSATSSISSNSFSQQPLNPEFCLLFSQSSQNRLHTAFPCCKHQHQPELPPLRSGSWPQKIPPPAQRCQHDQSCTVSWTSAPQDPSFKLLNCSCCSVSRSFPTLCDPTDCRLQDARLPCPLLSPRVSSNSCPLMPCNHLILGHPLLLPSIFPSIRVFPSGSALRIRWIVALATYSLCCLCPKDFIK